MRTVDQQWQEIRAATSETSERFCRMLCAADRPEARTPGTWRASDTAAHVATIAALNAARVSTAPTPLALPEITDDLVLSATLDDVGLLNATTIEHLGTRSLPELAGLVGDGVDHLLAETADIDPAAPVTWLGSSTVSVAAVLSHTLSELLVHGLDIARTQGRRWPIPPAYGAMMFERFLLDVLRNPGRLGEGYGLPRRRPLVAEVRSRHTAGPAVLVVGTDGMLGVGNDTASVDFQVSGNPTALLLCLYRRMSWARAALTGQLFVWGRRPWLVPAFLSAVRLP